MYNEFPSKKERLIDTYEQDLKKYNLGKEVPYELLNDYFPAEEGELNLYYGRIGSGKTYGATSDIHDDVKKGILVYATWPVKFYKFDDRTSGWMSFRNLLIWRKRYFEIDCPANFHFIDAEKGEVDGVYTFNPNDPKAYISYLNTLNHCKLYIDEAWRVIDSYTTTKDFGVDVRSLILVTRHKYRTINLIAQRPTSIQVTARANVNRFYKFIKEGTWPVPRFARYEFQDMIGETVNEEAEPISVKRYWGKREIFESYNSFFYGTLDPLHKLRFKAYDLTFKERVIAFARKIRILKTKIPDENAWVLLVPRKRCLPTYPLDEWDKGLRTSLKVREEKSYPQEKHLKKSKIISKITRKANAKL